MRIRKAVITAASRGQRTLPLQTLIDRDGQQKSVLTILLEEIVRARIDEICVVVLPGDEVPYAQVAGEHAGRLRFVAQTEPAGYGHAVLCARSFTGNDPFLHLVGDHLYIGNGEKALSERLVEVAEAEECSVSAVQATRESLLPYFGAVGGSKAHGRQGQYRVDLVLEKPTPTQAEQQLIVPGLRAGHYLCFFGMHVFTPAVMDILSRLDATRNGQSLSLSAALAELAGREQYIALELGGRRYDVGARYGLLWAQLALALSGQDKEEVLARLIELFATRESASIPAGAGQ
jgi:UTP--glucose-1-phosphate uridylyltransferase